MSGRLRAYVTLTVFSAVSVLALLWPQTFARDWGHYVAWIVICLVSDTMWRNASSGTATWSLSSTAGSRPKSAGLFSAISFFFAAMIPLSEA